MFQVPCLIENPSRFCHLKHLQLLLWYNMDDDNLSLVSLLGTALFIEKLEIHVCTLVSSLLLSSHLLSFILIEYYLPRRHYHYELKKKSEGTFDISFFWLSA